MKINFANIFRKIPVIIFSILLIGAGYYIWLSYNETKTEREKIESIEIKEYEGQDLSSVNDFRENSIRGPQQVDKESYRLKISGLNIGERELSYDEVISGYPAQKKAVTLYCVEGWDVNILWEGPYIKDIIKREDIAADKNTVIFRAYDGYSTSFPVEYIYDNNIILAYRMNGVELPAERGFPFQLVAESKWGYKWIKWITEIEFSSDENFQGYWESRGYSNSGNLGEGFYGY